MYVKQKRHKEIKASGTFLSSMLAGYSLDELKGDRVNELIKIVYYAGWENGMIYIIIADTKQNTIARTGIINDVDTHIVNRATHSNNFLKQTYKDSNANRTVYEFSRPIFKDGNKEGTVRLGFSPDIHPIFNDNDIRGLLLVVTLIFSFVPIFYYLVRRSLKLHALSITDELTGLYNRRGFFVLAENHFTLARRANKKLMLLYADVDNMKEINDSLGHDEGDRMLKDVAEILKSAYRTSDIVARIGGDEFVVFPVGTEEDHADKIIRRLENKLDTYNAKNKNKHELKISTGIAAHEPSTLDSLNELLSQADKEMYKKKNKRKSLLKTVKKLESQSSGV
jgi:diguanylate cyclase (GGDEF)-like protein